VSWIFWVVGILCGAILYWTSLILEWSGASMSRHKSLFAAEMRFLPLQTGSSVRQTHKQRYAFCSNVSVFRTHRTHTFLNNRCSWIIICKLPTHMHTLDAISPTAISLFSKISSLMGRMFKSVTAVGCTWAYGRLATCSRLSENLLHYPTRTW
jgi:hypothetical protein